MWAKYRQIGRLIAATLLLAMLGSEAMAQCTPGATDPGIAKVRDLDFGACDNVKGKYTVDPVDVQTAASCTGAYSARFEVCGTPNAMVTVVTDSTVTITNGTSVLSVSPDRSPKAKNVRLDASGNLTIFVGGSFSISPGGVATTGLFSGTSLLTVTYK